MEVQVHSTDWLVLLAIILGPILAVIVSRIIEKRSEKRCWKERVFRNLIAYQFQIPIDPLFLEALNLVPVVFHDKEGIKSARNEYLTVVQKGFDALNASQKSALDADMERVFYNNSLDNLLNEISKDIGYKELTLAHMSSALRDVFLTSDSIKSNELFEVVVKLGREGSVYFERENRKYRNSDSL